MKTTALVSGVYNRLSETASPPGYFRNKSQSWDPETETDLRGLNISGSFVTRLILFESDGAVSKKQNLGPKRWITKVLEPINGSAKVLIKE